jgi:hypothetical protein
MAVTGASAITAGSHTLRVICTGPSGVEEDLDAFVIVVG